MSYVRLTSSTAEINFDVTGWEDDYGSGTYALAVTRPGESTSYAATIDTSTSGIVTWQVSATDTEISGYGSCVLSYTVSSAVVKSVTYTTAINVGGATVVVDSALDNTSTNPVENQAITAALANTAAASHTHAASDITSGTLAIPRGGTGLAASPSMLCNLASTSAANVFQASPRPGVTGTLPIGSGGTSLTSSPSMLCNLASTSAANVFQASPRPGVTGTLPIGSGGTGANNASGALTNLGAQAALTFDSTPTSGSTNPVTSGGVYSALQNVSPNFSGIMPIENGGTGNEYGYIRTGLKSGTTAGNCATAEGYNCTASGNYAHAEGYNCTASGNYAHAEGSNCVANNTCACAGGSGCTASNTVAFAHGSGCVANGSCAVAMGSSCSATGFGACAIGWGCYSGNYSTALGYYSVAMGNYAFAAGNSSARGDYSVAMGQGSTATSKNSVAIGYQCVCYSLFGNYSVALGYMSNASAQYQTVVGRCNVVYANTTYPYGPNESAYFIVGKGTSNSARANCFRVATTAVYGAGAYNSSGADYAELFEWADGNPDNEDRAGLFVTLDGAQIRLVASNDDFVLGIVSGFPSVVGDVFDDQWAGMYVTDVFGRPVWEEVEVPAEYDDDGNEIEPAHTETRQKLNPAYDNTQKYKARTERPEWDAVGILGKLVAVDDGTCQVNGWATVGEGARATHSDERTKYRVMERLDENHIRVLIL